MNDTPDRPGILSRKPVSREAPSTKGIGRWARRRRAEESCADTAEPDSDPQPDVAFDVLPATEEPSLRRYSPFLLVLALLSLFLVSAAVLDAVRFTSQTFGTSVFVGVFFSALLIALAAALVWWGWRSIAELRQIKSIGRLRAQGDALVGRNDDPQLDADMEGYLDALAAHFADRPEMASRVKHAGRRIGMLGTGGRLSGRDRVSEISRLVLAEADERAASVVVLRSQQTALLAAVSRLPLLDLLISLWRSLSLVKEIAALYGARPGLVGTVVLMKSALYAVVFADVSQVAADGLAQTLGDRMLSALSAQAAQGVGLGLMIGRLGLQAVKVCRPIPFTGTEDTQPSFRMLSRAMAGLARQALVGKKKGRASPGKDFV